MLKLLLLLVITVKCKVLL